MKARAVLDKRSGRWRVVVDTRVKGRGRQTTDPRVFDNEKAAQRAAAVINTDIQRGNFTVPSRITVSEWLDEWLEKSAPLRGRSKVGTGPRRKSPTTLAQYRGVIDRWFKPKLGDIPLQRLTAVHIQDLVAEQVGRGAASNTVRNNLSILRQALDNAERKGLITRNPMGNRAIDLPERDHADKRVLTVPEMRDLLKKLEGHDLWLPAALALETGMRRGEILGLKWSHVRGCEIDISESLVRLPSTGRNDDLIQKGTKTGTSRTISISDAIAEELERHGSTQKALIAECHGHWKDSGHVFQRAGGGPLNPSTFTGTWIRVVKRIGYPGLRFHDLRHCHPSHLLELGMNPVAVAKRCGWVDTRKLFECYAHVIPGSDKYLADAMEALLSGNSGHRKLRLADNLQADAPAENEASLEKAV